MSTSEELIRQVIVEVLKQSMGGGGSAVPQVQKASDPQSNLESLPPKQIVTTKDGFEKVIDPSGVIGIKSCTVKTEPFGGQAGVSLKDVTTLEEAPRMGAGIMELDHTSFEWTLTYDEYDIVLDGTLEIEIDGRIVTGHHGDIIYIPKNTHIHFQSPDKCRYAYVVFPANWADQ